jgi:hypothetical protein
MNKDYNTITTHTHTHKDNKKTSDDITISLAKYWRLIYLLHVRVIVLMLMVFVMMMMVSMTVAMMSGHHRRRRSVRWQQETSER